MVQRLVNEAITPGALVARAGRHTCTLRCAPTSAQPSKGKKDGPEAPRSASYTPGSWPGRSGLPHGLPRSTAHRAAQGDGGNHPITRSVVGGRGNPHSSRTSAASSHYSLLASNPSFSALQQAAIGQKQTFRLGPKRFPRKRGRSSAPGQLETYRVSVDMHLGRPDLRRSLTSARARWSRAVNWPDISNNKAFLWWSNLHASSLLSCMQMLLALPILFTATKYSLTLEFETHSVDFRPPSKPIKALHMSYAGMRWWPSSLARRMLSSPHSRSK